MAANGNNLNLAKGSVYLALCKQTNKQTNDLQVTNG